MPESAYPKPQIETYGAERTCGMGNEAIRELFELLHSSVEERMTRDDRHDRLTRRGFIRQSGTLGAGAALGPIVLDLSACSTPPPGPEGPAMSSSVPAGTNAGPATATDATAHTAAGSSMTEPAAAGSGGGVGDAPAMAQAIGNAADDPSASEQASAKPSGNAAGDPSASEQASAEPSGNAAGDPSASEQASAEPSASGAPAQSGSADAPAAEPSSNAIATGAVLVGLYPGDGAAAMAEAAKRLDFSWLKPGDTVLIKVATNSPNKHPATTSVPGVQSMVKELKMRGAARVIVADQAGVEHVRSSSIGRYGKTSDCWATGGMNAVAPEAETYYFDDQPYETGYFAATLPTGNRWPRGMYVASIAREVDHIIYMPRIGQHIISGNTLGHKCAIGWLRDDSRHDVHNDAEDFYEKYTEINYVQEIRERFRMVVSVSEAVLLRGGPDVGESYTLDPVMVTASTSLANHDCIGAGVLVTLNKEVQVTSLGTMVYVPAGAAGNNAWFASGLGVPTEGVGPWAYGTAQTRFTAHDFESGITKDRSIVRGWELSGGKPASIEVVLDGAPLDDSLKSGLMTHGEGMYVFS